MEETNMIYNIDEKVCITTASAHQIDDMNKEEKSIYLQALKELIKDVKEEIEYVEMVLEES